MVSKSNKDNKIVMKFIGYVVVDSGQIVISDPCWLNHFVHDDFCPDSLAKGGKDFEYSYSGCCGATLSKGQAGQLKLKKLGGKKLKVPTEIGVAVGSRYGDWIYPVYAYYLNGQIMGVIIDFYIDELEGIIQPVDDDSSKSTGNRKGGNSND